MQSQEGMPRPPQYQVPDEQRVNTDPREQRQWQDRVAAFCSGSNITYENGKWLNHL